MLGRELIRFEEAFVGIGAVWVVPGVSKSFPFAAPFARFVDRLSRFFIHHIFAIFATYSPHLHHMRRHRRDNV